ncbi:MULTISPECIES: hypothetical protein [Cryobacterium]|uniref:MFS transporter n=1 Tax=Cryobacterium breve TaxID=1259258 RepID=A0ABY2JBX9_9MICO|nr:MULTISPECIES: hypothetical protein [Cryobacterium]TFC91191.1 hypothetical protein E3T20_14285 [Cryobacterium sp. TmT3-12]TFD01114.1 hypothetical protein E3O65_02130 [Cryobacterium breve]
MLTGLRTWHGRRWMIAAGVAAAALVVLTLATGSVAVAGGSLVFPGAAWASAVTVVGVGLIGLVAGSYFDAPIGGEATRCDVRWPVLGLIAVYLTTELREAVPLISDAVRPVVAVAALALLMWALLERLGREHRAVAGRSEIGGDGEVCTTCKPLFPEPRNRA